MLGDTSARNAGRLSLNPLRHLDPIGLVCLVLFSFGWAKPVPVNPYGFRSVDGKTGIFLTALAGPMSNIVMCFLCVGLISFLPVRVLYSFTWLYGFLNYMVWINASLAFFNLLPVPPLDGSKVLFGILPGRMYHILRTMEQYGFILLTLLLIARIPERVIGPLSRGLVSSFVQFYGLFG